MSVVVMTGASRGIGAATARAALSAEASCSTGAFLDVTGGK